MTEPKRRKSPKFAVAKVKTTVLIPSELDARIYEFAQSQSLGISEAYVELLTRGLDALATQAHQAQRSS